MVVLTFEEHIARKIVDHYDKDWDEAVDSLDRIEEEICSLAENCNVELDGYNNQGDADKTLSNYSMLCGNCHEFVSLDDCEVVTSLDEGYYFKCANCGARFKVKAEPLGTAKVRFHPQAWQDDYAVPVDPEGETEYEVPIKDATDEEGKIYPDDDPRSDGLKDHENAPDWVKEWQGPFYITIEEVDW